jgi:NAD(P)H-hydrate epimerase
MRLLRGELATLAVPSSVVRDMDRRAIGEYGLPGIALMENAGAAIAAVAAEMCPPRSHVLVVAGPGNNGGDGFVVARLLVNCGSRVTVVTSVAPESYEGDAAKNLGILSAMGLRTRLWDERIGFPPDCSLVIDALLGTGLSGDLRPPYPAIIAAVNSLGVPVLAVDIPSGIDGDTGTVHTIAVKAGKTVTFALPKSGLFAAGGPSHAGEVILADIGIPYSIYPPGKSLVAL